MDLTRRQRWLARSLLGLAVALGAIAVLGPAGLGEIHYRVSGRMLSQLKGADAVMLLVVVPVSALAAGLARRGHRAGPPLALAPALYALYMLAESIVGPDYGRVPGNGERFFPLLLGTFVLAGVVAVQAWSLIPAEAAALGARRARRLGGLLVGLAAMLVVGRYLPGLADVMRARPTNADYLAGPTIFWIIALEDLGIVIPAMLAVGIGLWRQRPWAARASFAVAGWAGLVPLAVAGMGLASYLDRQPSVSAGTVALLGALAAAFLIPAAVCYRPLLPPDSRPSRTGTQLPGALPVSGRGSRG